MSRRDGPHMSAETEPRADPDALAGPDPVEPSTLQARYRRLLLLLPAGDRAVREQEMTDIFLQREYDADPENADLTARYGWPGLPEALSVLALAVRVRWSGVDTPQRAQVRQRALHVAVLGALTVCAVMAVNILLGRIWFTLAHPQYDGGTFPGLGSTGALVSTVRAWSFLLWIAAFVAVLAARPRWAQLAGLIPLLSVLVSAVATRGLVGSWVMVGVQTAVLAGLSGIKSGAPVPGARRGWIAGAGAGAVLVSGVTLAAALVPAVRYPAGVVVVDSAGFWCAAAVSAAAVLLARRARGTQVSIGALLGVATLAGAAALLRAGMLIDRVRFLPPDYGPIVPLLIAGTVQLLLAAMVAAVTGVRGARRFRRLPPVRYDTVTGA